MMKVLMIGLLTFVCLRNSEALASASPDSGVDSPQLLRLSVGRDDSTPRTALLTVEDVQGSYTIPYIQSDRNLHIQIVFDAPNVVSGSVALSLGDKTIADQPITGPEFRARSDGLDPGEYEVRIRGFDGKGAEQMRVRYERIGIGLVLAALGDSITEGYYGRGFLQQDLQLRAEDFPANAVSRDGRNFPQFAPTTHVHLPSVNCFESWMTRLNDLLADAWHQPVFIANEGWGGITSAGYLEKMRTDQRWRKRMTLLKPRVWLIHLGVNDERALVSASDFAANMTAIVDTLIREFEAKPHHIFVAKPSYDYFEGAPEILTGYNEAIDRLVAERGLQPGPDFFSLYATEKERWYGDDPVHPNQEGVNRMADAWRDALADLLGDEARP